MASGSLRLLVVGNTSSGKTTTINSILGKGNILSEDYFSRDTSGYQSAERSGTVVEVSYPHKLLRLFVLLLFVLRMIMTTAFAVL